ncbi:Putative decaprenyl diphosphate synthase-like superfamily [Acrodontium crateriforme]|uniref:ditrans,polycis-polyprenyl diphosphate synthase [(2E,6E)-farnesyldiphosphate specific] n=1 Tax=Acrodontium crateriforme TaxID=150365 RepID=A0AAQ3M3I1_9PEZI|nr:Putative decaprenyl diphosphate synthase-like superfamily [Acrodontium crateriforme]
MMGGLRNAGPHADIDKYGRRLSATEREKLLKPYLPPVTIKEPPSEHTNDRSGSFHHRPRVRPAIRQLVYSLVFTVVHLFFSIYIRVRQLYHTIVGRILTAVHYHHRTPELIRRDVKSLSKIPKHLSVMLELSPEGGKKDSLETLLNDACEITAWSASAGVPTLSIYERTGVLKASLPNLHRHISRTLTAYFGPNSPMRPTVSLRAPNMPSYSPPYSPETNSNDASSAPHLNIILIDATDGRQTLVDLTKTLAEMSQHGKLSPADISNDLIDAEINESVMGEPDLLILFGDRIVLDGYPPWQVRLTEIFYAQDNTGGVGYHIFLRALYKYARAEIRFGR